MKYIIIILLLTSCVSCTTIKKVFSKNKSKVDSTSISKIDSTRVIKVDSGVVHFKSDTNSKTTEHDYEKETIIEEWWSDDTTIGIYTGGGFTPIDSANVLNGTGIIGEWRIGGVSGDGINLIPIRRTTIKEKGKIVSQETKKAEELSTTDLHKSDSASSQKENSTTLSKQEKQIEKKADIKRFPVIPVTIAALIAGIVIYLFLWIRRKKRMVDRLKIPPI